MIALVAALHFGAVYSGFYDWQFSTRVFWFDNVLHGFVGIGFAMAALFVMERLGRPTGIAAQSAVALAATLGLALVWELVEYIFFTQFTEYAYWSKIYSPSVGEALADTFSDVVGAALFLIVWQRR